MQVRGASVQVVVLLEQVLLQRQTCSGLLVAVVGESGRLVVVLVQVVGSLGSQRRLRDRLRLAGGCSLLNLVYQVLVVVQVLVVLVHVVRSSCLLLLLLHWVGAWLLEGGTRLRLELLGAGQELSGVEEASSEEGVAGVLIGSLQSCS